MRFDQGPTADLRCCAVRTKGENGPHNQIKRVPDRRPCVRNAWVRNAWVRNAPERSIIERDRSNAGPAAPGLISTARPNPVRRSPPASINADASGFYVFQTRPASGHRVELQNFEGRNCLGFKRARPEQDIALTTHVFDENVAAHSLKLGTYAADVNGNEVALTSSRAKYLLFNPLIIDHFSRSTQKKAQDRAFGARQTQILPSQGERTGFQPQGEFSPAHGHTERRRRRPQMLFDTKPTVGERDQQRCASPCLNLPPPYAKRGAKQRDDGNTEHAPQSRRQIATNLLDAPQNDQIRPVALSLVKRICGGRAPSPAGEQPKGQVADEGVFFHDQHLSRAVCWYGRSSSSHRRRGAYG